MAAHDDPLAPLTAFAAGAPGRSVAARTLRGPVLAVAARAEVPRPAASLVKVPLAVAVVLAGDLDEAIRVRDIPRPPGPSVLAVLDQERTLTVRELTGLLLATSDNGVERLLVDRVGVASAQVAAEHLGARATELRAAPGGGLDPRASTTTAADALELVVAVATATDGALALVAHALRQNVRDLRIPLGAPEHVPVAHKTGTLHGVAHDAGIVFAQDVDLAVAFLTEDEQDTLLASWGIGRAVAGTLRGLGQEVRRGWSLA